MDFVIGQKIGYPVGTIRSSPAEFRRRVLAAAVSYQLQLNSIDYTLKRYVEPDQYENDDSWLGDEASDCLRDSSRKLMEQLRSLHTEQPTFGMFGAEITLYRLPHSLDVARMLSNRGLLLEVLPVLRLCVEMLAWSSVAFHQKDENEVVALQAQSCISKLKTTYKTAGRIYGYLSRFSHWGHDIHGQFLHVSPQQVAVLNASVRYRAMALALCFVILDVFVEVVRALYLERGNALVEAIQEVLDVSAARTTSRMIASIAEMTGLPDLVEIQSLLQ